MHDEPTTLQSLTRRQLPLVLPGPPGHPALQSLQPPDADDDVALREGESLPEWAQTTARAFAEVLFMTNNGPPDAGRIAWLIRDFSHFVSASSGRAAEVMKLSLFALTWVAPLFVWRPFYRLESLTRWQRIRALDAMEASLLGPAVLGVKAMLCMIWLEHPDTQHETRTVPTCKLSTGATHG